MQWEKDHDCLLMMKDWLIRHNLAGEDQLAAMETEVAETIARARESAWAIYQQAIRKEKTDLLKIIKNKSCICRNENIDKIRLYTNNLIHIENPIRKDNISTAKKILRHVCADCPKRESFKGNLMKWLNSELCKRL